MWRSAIELARLRHKRVRTRDSGQSSKTHNHIAPLPGEMQELKRTVDSGQSSMTLNPMGAAPERPIESMDPEAYKAVIYGNLQKLEELLHRDENPVLGQVTPQQNTILHLAAINGYSDLVKKILDHEKKIVTNQKANSVGDSASNFPRNQTLLLRPNSKGNLALHVAAAAGHVSVVDHLIEFLREIPQDMEKVVLESEQVTIGNLLGMTNNEGDTALHLALKGNHLHAALSIVRADFRTSLIPDSKSVSPVYMAAEAGHAAVVEVMLQGSDASLKGKSVVYAAIRSKNLDILKVILEKLKDSDLVNSKDEAGRSPLSYAASIGFDSGVKSLLNIQTAYVQDRDGSFPIHSACRAGQTSALEEILQNHPDTIELLNTQGQNVLHLAAESGKAKNVDYLLRKPDIEKLINEKDTKGNTPLHLASINWHPKVVSLLIWDERVNLNTLNDESFTALDAVEEHLAPIPSLQQWLTWVALVSAGATKAFQIHLREDVPCPGADEELSLKIYKNRVNTLLVVATLVATMSFAAGLSVPLGYNSTDFKSNAKNPYEDSAFHAFVISNSIAVYGAVISTVALIGVQPADINCILTMLKFVVPLLSFAIIAMSLAFLAGLYLILGQRHWLAIFVLASGGFYLTTLLLLIVPFISPYTLSPLLFRHVLRYPFFMLASFAEWKDGTGDYADYEPTSLLKNPKIEEPFENSHFVRVSQI